MAWKDEMLGWLLISDRFPIPRPGRGRGLEYLVVLFGLLAVAWVDHVTGSDIHVVSLYFVPLAHAGWRFGRLTAMVASLIATSLWLAALYTTGVRYAESYIWIVNFFTQGVAFMSIALLVASLGAALRREQARSRTDYLTGLLNREGFREQAAYIIPLGRRHNRPVSLAYIDLDRFKHANDLFGHAYGDKVLQICAQKISQARRAGDVAARLGGDEFVILLPETDSVSAKSTIERLRLALQDVPDLKKAGVTASIGVVTDQVSAMNIDEMLKHADLQMYEAKRNCKTKIPA
jgi:diguanylate cyclase (GGDEF)-like protein